MKGKFDVDPSLLSLDETLKAHNPYMVITVSSTGLNGHLNDFADHRPTRVFIQEYVYNNETKEYTEGLTFDRMVKCSPESLRQAIMNEASYDVFKQGGINKDAYIQGVGVEEVDTFKKDFEDFLSSHAENTKFIINNTSFCVDMLDKIGCADELKKQIQEHNVLDQPTLTKSYFAEHNINMQTTLENLNNFINLTNDSSKIEGIDKRAKVISDFIQRRGREKGLLASEIDVENNKTELTYINDIANSGRQNYRNADVEKKLQILEKQGNLSVDVLKRDFKCDINAVFDILEGKNNVKGVVIIQCATTGFSAGDAPIQISAIKCDLDNGRLKPVKAISFDMECDSRSLRQAVKCKEAIGKEHFDAFEFTGINYEAYKNGFSTDKNGNINKDVKLLTEDQAINRIKKFFSEIDLNEYPVITNGGAGRAYPNQSYAQMALSHLGNFAVNNVPYIDFSKAVMEYSFVSHFDKKYPKNILLDEDKWEGETFSLIDIAKYRNQDIKHTSLKCAFMGNLLNDIASQHIEMLNEQEHNVNLENSQPSQPISNVSQVETAKPSPMASAAPISRDITNNEKPNESSVEQLPSHKERPVVTYTIEVAKEKGKEALQNWRVSQRENRVCAQNIADELQKHKNGSSIDFKGALDIIQNNFPQKRIDCVLAHEIYRSVDELNRPVYWDRRIDKSVQEWAKKILSAEEGFDFSSFQYCDIASKTNTSIINDLISQYIGIEKERGLPQERQSVQRHHSPSTNRVTRSSKTPTFTDENYQGEYEGKYRTNEEAFISEGYDNIVEGIDNIPDNTDIARRAIREAEQAEWEMIKENIDGEYEEREVFRASPSKEKTPTINSASRPNASNVRNNSQSDVSYSNADITALISAFTDQTKAIREQTAVMQEQFNSVLKIINLQAQALSFTVEALVDRSQDKSNEKAENAIEKLANVKDQISDVYSQINNRTAKGLLQNANDLISKGQNQLEEIDEPTKRNERNST